MGEASLVQYAIKNMGLVAHHAAQNKIRENQRIISTLARDVEGGAEVDVVVQEAGVDSVREEVAAEVQVAEGGQKDLVSQEDQLLEENRSACILPHALCTWKCCIFICNYIFCFDVVIIFLGEAFQVFLSSYWWRW